MREHELRINRIVGFEQEIEYSKTYCSKLRDDYAAAIKESQSLAVSGNDEAERQDTGCDATIQLHKCCGIQ